MAVTNTPIQVSYTIPDVSAVLGTYTKMRWWRSTSETGVYTAITADAAEAASLLTPSLSPYQIENLELNLRVNNTVVDHTFTDTDPVTHTEAAAELAAASGLIDAPLEGSQFRIQSATVGGDTSVEVLGGDASASLGFSAGDCALGKDADSVLVSGTHEYFLTDDHSDVSYWYRVQFVNEATPAYSELGIAFSADQPAGIPKSEMLVCFIRLADPSGCPIPCRKISFHNVPMPNKVDASNGTWGVFRNTVTMETDRNGYAEIRLLRGAVFEMVIDSSGFVRRFTVPTTGDAIDLLDPTLVVEDEFGIQQPSVTPAVRIS